MGVGAYRWVEASLFSGIIFGVHKGDTRWAHEAGLGNGFFVLVQREMEK